MSVGLKQTPPCAVGREPQLKLWLLGGLSRLHSQSKSGLAGGCGVAPLNCVRADAGKAGGELRTKRGWPKSHVTDYVVRIGYVSL